MEAGTTKGRAWALQGPDSEYALIKIGVLRTGVLLCHFAFHIKIHGVKMIRSLVRMTSSLSVCLAGSMALLALPVMAQRGPVPELKYMSPKCASMLEAQRTAPSVMRNQPSFAEMRRNYNDQCAEDQSQAQRRWYAEKRETEQLNAEQDYAMKKQQLLSANEVKRKSDQCMEMRSALESRKKRTNLTEGEKRDLGLFETRYQERCN